MWVRKRLDIGWSDLASGALKPCFGTRASARRRVEDSWPGSDALACLSVRSGFDLLLDALQLPPRSEVLISALTIGQMVEIIKHYGLVPVPVDLDCDSLAPNLQAMRRAVTPATRAVLVAHLFGGRLSMEPVVDLARRHELLLIEDCAQVYAGENYRGHPDAQVAMFSFGPIKTATALGGAILDVRDDKLLERMRLKQESYPVQTTRSYLRRMLKYAVLQAISSRPVFGALVRTCRAMGYDHDRLINHSARSFPGPRFREQIRQQPSKPLLALLERRLRRFDVGRIRNRKSKGDLLAGLLRGRIESPGQAARPHTHWVFPILVDNPAGLIAKLRRAGFDATCGESLSVVDAPPDRTELEPRVARAILSGIVFLPLYPEMPDREVRRMAQVLLRDCDSTALRLPAISHHPS